MLKKCTHRIIQPEVLIGKLFSIDFVVGENLVVEVNGPQHYYNIHLGSQFQLEKSELYPIIKVQTVN